MNFTINVLDSLFASSVAIYRYVHGPMLVLPYLRCTVVLLPQSSILRDFEDFEFTVYCASQ